MNIIFKDFLSVHQTTFMYEKKKAYFDSPVTNYGQVPHNMRHIEL